jgi:t-SNARE complex subunit (syntaxin)
MSYLTLHPESSATLNKDAGISLAHQIMQIKSSFKNITEMLPKQSSEARHSRHKRIIPYLIGLAAAAIVGAIVGTYFGPYNQAQLDALPLLDSMDLLLHIDSSHHHLLDDLNNRVNSAFQVLRAHDEDFRNFDNHITIWNAIIKHLQSRLDQFVDFVTQLQHRRLSLTWFTEQQMRNIHGSVLQQAHKNNLIPLTQHLTDYFQMDVSYVRSEHFITAIIHVPATASDSYFKVYRYIPFPIPLSDSHVLNIHAREDIIAVGHNNLHRVLSQTQLNNCNRHYNKYICESPLITNNNFSTTCVGSLMDHNPVGIQTHCSISSSPSQETVFQITNNQFAIYSPETFTGRGQCSNGTALSALISTISKVTVPPGCTFNLRNHVLTVPINVFTSAEPWVQQTKWDTLEVPKQLLLNDLRRQNAIHQLLSNDELAQAKMQTGLKMSDTLINAANMSITHQTLAVHQAVSMHFWFIIGLAVFCTITFITLCTCMCRRYKNAATVLQPYIATLPMTAQQETKF